MLTQRNGGKPMGSVSDPQHGRPMGMSNPQQGRPMGPAGGGDHGWGGVLRHSGPDQQTRATISRDYTNLLGEMSGIKRRGRPLR